MNKTDLTPELAASLLANLYPRQRKLSRPRITQYSRRMQEGKWTPYNPSSPIMVDHKTGQMYNGRQRCTAVVQTGVTIKVYLDDEHDADTYFDFIDIELPRNATQFIMGTRASVRSSAARIILWHEQAFDQSISSTINRWQMDEVMVKAEEYANEFDAWMPYCDAAYFTNHISTSVMLAASVLSDQAGHGEITQEFLEKLAEPAGLDILDPAYVLHRKMTNIISYKIRRQPQQDWLLFVRCLNAAINDEALPSNIHSNVSVWPDIGDKESEVRRRISRAASQKSEVTRLERRVRARVQAELEARSAASMAASGSDG